MVPLKIDAYLPELHNDVPGISRPVTVICEDGNTYFLKNQNVYYNNNWVNFNSMFLQEMLVSNICSYLNIETPSAVLIEIDEGILKQHPTLLFNNRFKKGLHFGTKLIDNIENNLLDNYLALIQLKKKFIKRSWNTFFNNVYNKEDVSKIIALDLLTNNFDRFTNMGNLLVSNNNGIRKIHAIDHGHCFRGPIWNFEKTSFLKSVDNNTPYNISIIKDYLEVNKSKPLNGLGEIFNAIQLLVDLSNPNNHDFIEVVHKIEGITPDIIDNWFLNIPDSWYINKDIQISNYKSYILTQRNNIREIITLLVSYGAFSNITGGELTWKENKAGIQ